MKYFGTLWQKLRRKIVIPPSPTPSFLHKIFLPYQQFSETQNASLAKFFRSCERKKNSTKPWSFPPPLLETFRDQKSFETQKLIGTERQKIFDGKSWFPPLLSINFFDKGNFVKQRRDPLRSFSVLWDNKVSIENRYIPLLGIKFLDTRFFLKHRRVPRRKFSPLWDKFFSTKNRDTLLHKVQKSVVDLLFVRAFWKLISKQ